MVIENDNDKVWVTVGATVNLGNYENIKIDMGQSRTIGPTEDPDELRKKITETILVNVIDIMEEIKPGGTKKPPSGRRLDDYTGHETTVSTRHRNRG